MVPAESAFVDGGELTNSIFTEMQEPLLRTKLFFPAVLTHRVPRPRLYKQIQSGLDKPLILVTAPAGFGKTTLVSGWLHESRTASTWLSLDEEDNDPVRFFQYLIAALQKIVPAIQLDLMVVLQGRHSAPSMTLMNVLINYISERATPFILVLDDFHSIRSQTVLDLFIHLVEHMPPQMHILLLSRTDPPIPIPRLRAHNQLADIRTDQLRFTRDEVDQFLNDVMGLEVTAEDLLTLDARTEGWIAGLQLAAISMSGGKDAHTFVSAFSGSHHYIMDYLVEEVLKLQTGPVRSFLLQTSILERMCAPLCDSVVLTGNDGEPHPAGIGNAQTMLEALERMNLFTFPLDSERRWYRYHHLFADVLNRRLEQAYPHLLPDLHRRAARWYESSGLIFDAIHHTLLAGDNEHAAKLLDQNGCLLLMRGEVISLLHWIEAVEPYSKIMPWIAIQKGWALCLTGQVDRAEAALQTAEHLVGMLEQADEVSTLLGALTAARAYRENLRGETSLSARLARQALAALPMSSDLSCSLRSVATSLLGDASWLEGHLEEAEQAYEDAVRISRVAGNVHLILTANCNLGEVLLEQGQLRQAARIYSQSLQIAQLPDEQTSPYVDRVYAGLGSLAYEWNYLEDAARNIQECLNGARKWGNIDTLAAGLVLKAQLEQAQCHPETAQEALHAVERLLNEHPFSAWRTICLKSDLARLWMMQGDLGRAADLVHRDGCQVEGIPKDGVLPYLLEPLYLVQVRLQIVRGEVEAALTLSGWLSEKLAEQKRTGRLIETLILRAVAFQARGDLDQAMKILEKAVLLGQPERYQRIFLDEGEPLAKLIYQSRLHQTCPGYAGELFQAFRTTLPARKLLTEPLTERELQVLQRIEAGCSNQEIAAEFVISLPTVKRHISNIYAKLGVNSRTQAVLRGKELHLFE